MKQVTLYNHRRIGNDDKPLILNIQFKETVERLNKGEGEAYLEALEKYSLTPFQKEFFQHKYKQIKL